MEDTKKRNLTILEKIKIEDFKGVKNLDLDITQQKSKLYADNGVGKTTLADAISWVLVGKDSKNNTIFEFKPLKSGTKQAKLNTNPKVDINIGGNKLTKIAKEQRTNKGTFKGNSIQYYVNDIEKSKKDYESSVEKITGVSIKELQILINANAFTSLKWQDQREILKDLFINEDNVKDSKLAEDFDSELSQALELNSVEDIKKSYNKQIKDAKSNLDQIDGQIQENETHLESYDLDFSQLEKEKDEIKENLKSVENSISNITSPKEIDNRIKELKNENQELGLVTTQKEINKYTDELDHLQSQRRELIDNVYSLKLTKEDLERRISNLNKELESIDTTKTCPTCNQTVKDGDLEKHKQEIESKIKQLNGNLEKTNKEHEKVVEQGKKIKSEIERVETLKSNVEMPKNVLETIKLNNETINELLEEKKELENGNERDELLEKKEQLNDKLNSINNSLYKKELRDNANKRIEELNIERERVVDEMDKLELKKEKINNFLIYKAEIMEGKINENFNNIHFSLFKYNNDGELAGEHCEVFWQDKPFSALSRSESIKAGLEIIKGISEKLDTYLPVVIDDAEAITTIPEMESQTIELIKPQISEEDLSSKKYNKIIKGE